MRRSTAKENLFHSEKSAEQDPTSSASKGHQSATSRNQNRASQKSEFPGVNVEVGVTGARRIRRPGEMGMGDDIRGTEEGQGDGGTGAGAGAKYFSQN